jgi:ubiquinone/menaquinone biosynthesis C-methylase UbiE
MTFDPLAEYYERYRTGYSPEVYDIIRDYGLDPGARVLDIGCGTGLASSDLAERGYEVTGIDQSPAMLSFAKSRVPDGTFLEGSAESLPWTTATFDGATCAQAFHWFDAPRVRAEVVRVVRPGGPFAIWWKTLIPGDPTRLAREEIERAMGAEPGPDMRREYATYDGAPLVDLRMRVIPWIVTLTVGHYLGYERSRANARRQFADRIDEYFGRLAARLGDPAATLSLTYVHYLHLGKVPGEPKST